MSLDLTRHAESLAGVTPPAVFECQIATKRTPSVMTRQAVRAAQGKVFGRCGRTYLARLSRARCQRMAIGTRKALAWAMFSVAESKAKRSRVSRCSGERFLIVTNTTRCHFAPSVRLTAWGVARVTTIVSIQTNRDGQRRASQQWSVVTAVAAIARTRCAGHVLGMVKLNIEFLIKSRRETLKWRVGALHICMTNLAHRNSRSNELGQVTVSAGLVTGKFRCRRIVATAFMAGSAGLGSVTLAAVDKLRVVELGILGHAGGGASQVGSSVQNPLELSVHPPNGEDTGKREHAQNNEPPSQAIFLH